MSDVARLGQRDPDGQHGQRPEEVALVDDVVAVHDPDSQDPRVGRHLAHDARDERPVAQGGAELADQRIRRDRRVPRVPDHLAWLVTGQLRVLACEADDLLDVVIDLDEAVAVVAGIGVVPARWVGHHIQEPLGADARVQDGDHRAAAVTVQEVAGQVAASRRIQENRDRCARVSAAEQVGVGAGGSGAAARVRGEPAAAAVGRAPGDGRADEQMLERDPVDVRLVYPVDVRLARLPGGNGRGA